MKPSRCRRRALPRPRCPEEAEARGRRRRAGWQRSGRPVARSQIPAPGHRRLQNLRRLHRKPPASPRSPRSPRTTIASACSAGSLGSRRPARSCCTVRWAATRDLACVCGGGPTAAGSSGREAGVLRAPRSARGGAGRPPWWGPGWGGSRVRTGLGELGGPGLVADLLPGGQRAPPARSPACSEPRR